MLAKNLNIAKSAGGDRGLNEFGLNYNSAMESVKPRVHWQFLTNIAKMLRTDLHRVTFCICGFLQVLRFLTIVHKHP